jgi:mRNA-degrading endonuclease YafQ of YafQ-DinJ toxin-antitoxin module
MREINYTARFKRDYRRERSGKHGRKLDALLMEVVNLLAADTPLPRRNVDHALSGERGAAHPPETHTPETFSFGLCSLAA